VSSPVRGLRWILPWFALLGVSSTAALAMQVGATNYFANAVAVQKARSTAQLAANPTGTRIITLSWHSEASGIDQRMSCITGVNEISTDELIVDEKDIREVRASLCRNWEG
jgi:hypothetical protein